MNNITKIDCYEVLHVTKDLPGLYELSFYDKIQEHYPAWLIEAWGKGKIRAAAARNEEGIRFYIVQEEGTEIVYNGEYIWYNVDTKKIEFISREIGRNADKKTI